MKLVRFILLLLLIPMLLHAQPPLYELLLKYREAPQDTSRVVIAKSLASYYKNISPDSSIFYAQQGLKLANKLNYTRGLAQMNSLLGEVAMSQGKMNEARRKFDVAFRLFEKINSKKDLASIHNGLGIWAIKQGAYSEATRRFLLAQQIFEQANDTSGVIQAYIKLGVVNQQTGDLNKALDYYTKGMQLDAHFPSTDRTGTLLNNIGIIYFYRKDYRTALRYFLEGLKKTTKPEWADVRILLLSNAGSCYENLNTPTASIMYQKEALQLIRQRNMKEYEINALVSLASVIRKSKPDSSQILLKQALSISKEINQRYLMLDVYKGMIDLYKHLGRYKETVDVLEARNLLQDSLFSVKKSKEVAELQSNFKIAQQTVALKDLQLTNQRIIFNQRIVIGIAISVCFLFLIAVLFFIRTRRLNKMLMQQQKALKQQKETLNKMNTFKDKLFSIIGHDLRSPVATIVSLMETAEDVEIPLPEFRSFIPRLKEHSRATLDTMDKLLVWGRLQLDGSRNEKSKFNAKELIVRNIALYNHAALEKMITLSYNSPKELLLYADETHIDFIVRNLLANAIKFTRIGGKVEVIAETNCPDGFTCIIVKDNGIGIDIALQEQIFKAGNQSMDGTASEKGNSIGLMFCKEFAEENNGHISIKSELGYGTEFILTLPAHRANC